MPSFILLLILTICLLNAVFVVSFTLRSNSPLTRLNKAIAQIGKNRIGSIQYTQLQASSPVTADDKALNESIDIYSRDFELTPLLRQRVLDKIGKVVSKLSKGRLFRNAHVVLKVSKYPDTEHHTSVSKKDSQIVEVTVRMKGGVVIHASESSDDMYASIDLVSHKLAKKMKKHNEKVKDHQNLANSHEQVSSMLLYAGEPAAEGNVKEESFDEEELLIDLDKKYKDFAADSFVKSQKIDMSVIKPKAFPMPPISVQDAVLCLQFVEHPFYVFRNKDTNEINVVYKRDNGGVGHIMPEAAK